MGLLKTRNEGFTLSIDLWLRKKGVVHRSTKSILFKFINLIDKLLWFDSIYFSFYSSYHFSLQSNKQRVSLSDPVSRVVEIKSVAHRVFPPVRLKK